MRLIDADALTMLLHDDIDGLDEEFPNDKQVKPYMCGVKMALSFIETAPTIDAVPVVRCKDCKHWQPSEYGVVEQPYCKHLGYKEETGLDIQIGNENDYCSFGERKDNE